MILITVAHGNHSVFSNFRPRGRGRSPCRDARHRLEWCQTALRQWTSGGLAVLWPEDFSFNDMAAMMTDVLEGCSASTPCQETHTRCK